MNPQFWWYLARASGVVAWLILTASVLWGIVLATDLFSATRRPAWLLDLHRWLGALVVGFTAIHIAALVADSYVQFSVADIAVPLASDYKTGAVAWGVLAMWLLVAVEVSSLVMKRIPRRIWRGIHRASAATFWMASLHGTYAGTDAPNRLYAITSIVAAVAVMLALLYRLITAGARKPERSSPRKDHDARDPEGQQHPTFAAGDT
ncbi:MAG: ferric reductase-like transmembrane domain-containing protein [Acidimicrobiales bacterium]